MSNSKKMLSFLLAVIIIVLSVTSSTAVIAPEDSISAQVQWMYKIDDVLLDKMSNAAETDLIPVWVWMTDIDMEQLDKDIETRTGVSQQKLETARAEIGFDVSTVTAYDLSDIDSSASAYREATKAQREQIANDTQVYLAAKKSLASQRYTTANTAKIRQIGVSNNRIDFQSTLTPSFIAFLTKAEIIETAQSDNVVEMGYFSEYDAELTPAPTQARAMAEDEETSETEAPSQLPTLDVSTLHTGIKQVIQHDDALEKYGVTGNGIKVLHIDHDFVRSDYENINLVPHPTNIVNIVPEGTVSVTDYQNLPFSKKYDHANICVSYLQAFAKDVNIYVIPTPDAYEDTGINPYNYIEETLQSYNIDLINASCDQHSYTYINSFASKWYDAIVVEYQIPVIASAGNTRSSHSYPIAPASGYNSIAVGAYEFDSGKIRNEYTFTPEGDINRVAYKPDLVVAMDVIESDGKLYYGATSAGATVVSAIVAMMMEQAPILKGQPEVIKAILMASCQEKAIPGEIDGEPSPTEVMDDGLTIKQGSGKVNALRALNIVEYGTYGSNYLSPNQNGSAIGGINLRQQGVTDNVKYPLNVSIAWLRGNTQSLNDDGTFNITLGDYYNLYLSVYYNGQSSDNIKTSTADNAGKQLVYISQPEWNSSYNIRAYWRNGANDKRSRVKIGYAYSIGSFEKVLERIEITGQTAVGKTLTANTYTNDGLLMNADELNYVWYSSTDGDSWQIINGANSNTYTLTDSDLNKYIKCIVEQDYLINYWITKDTAIRVVRYGDVNNDGNIDALDITLIQRFFNNLVTLTPEQIIAADVNGDEVINSLDVTLIQRYEAGYIDHFPVED